MFYDSLDQRKVVFKNQGPDSSSRWYAFCVIFETAIVDYRGAVCQKGSPRIYGS